MPRALQNIGMVFFIEGVGRNGHRRTLADGVSGPHFEARIVQTAQHDILGRAGFGAQGAAFQDLAQMIAQRRVMAPENAHRRKRRGIVGPAADDDIRLLFQRLQHRLRPHLRHHAVGGGQALRRQLRHIGRHGRYPSLLHGGKNGFVGNISPDHHQARIPAGLPGNFLDNIQRPQGMLSCAGTACRADHQRDLQTAGPRHQQGKILLGRHSADDGRARAQLMRACVRAARVYDDRVRGLFQRFFQRRCPEIHNPKCHREKSASLPYGPPLASFVSCRIRSCFSGILMIN